jgi:hypothetical protein
MRGWLRLNLDFLSISYVAQALKDLFQCNFWFSDVDDVDCRS